MNTPLAAARRALARLRRALEKGRRELRTMRSSLEEAGDDSLPGDQYDEAADQLAVVGDWLNSEEARLRAKTLEQAGLGSLGKAGSRGGPCSG